MMITERIQPESEARSMATFNASSPSTAPPPRSRFTAMSRVLAAAVVGALVASLTFVALGNTSAEAPPPVVETVVREVPIPAPVAVTGQGSVDAVAVGAAVIPSVVTVQIGSGSGNDFIPVGSGSGVIVDTVGRIVTNQHVVDGAEAVRIVLSDGRIYQAEVLGTDVVTDLAVVDINADALVPIALGATAELTVGDSAVAVGSPLGLDGGPSLTVGVISAFGREVQTGPDAMLYGMLQTDAPITQGSSGGALVDGSGRLIGITTAVGVSQIGVEGIGFATPVEIVARVADEIISTGAATHAFLGINGGTAFFEGADGGVTAQGVQVRTVEPGSAADAAGITPGDLIVAFDGSPVQTMDELIVSLRHYRVGDSVSLSILRRGSTVPLDVVLGSL